MDKPEPSHGAKVTVSSQVIVTLLSDRLMKESCPSEDPDYGGTKLQSLTEIGQSATRSDVRNLSMLKVLVPLIDPVTTPSISVKELYTKS